MFVCVKLEMAFPLKDVFFRGFGFIFRSTAASIAAQRII